MSLIEEVEEKTDQEKAKKIARKLKKGKGLTWMIFATRYGRCKAWEG